MKPKFAIYVFLGFIVCQFLLYANYITREVAWNYNLHGDPTWYIYFNYKLYNAVVEREWGVIWGHITSSPWGSLLFLETLVPQFLLGPSRFSIAVINLIYYIATQIIIYVFFWRLTEKRLGGVIAVAILMTMQTPFRGDGPGLNIADFHFDLVLFFLLTILHLMIAWSNSFEIRSRSILIGIFAGIIVATRLVSFFLLTGIMGIFGLSLLYRWWREGKVGYSRARRRLVGILNSVIIYIAISCLPIWVARNALYSHYFRFVFDEKFREDRAGLYVMGASSKLGEAYEVFTRMLKFDFGAGYISVGIILLLIVIIRVIKNTSYLKITNNPSSRANIELLGDAESHKTFGMFLLLSAIVSFTMHVIFPIKSDHLTRMTASPILIAIMLAIVPDLVSNWFGVKRIHRAFARCAVGIIVISAFAVQLNFYTGHGRAHETVGEMKKVSMLFSDISTYAFERGTKEIAISTDRISNFELGALLGMAVFNFEHNGIYIDHHPKLGGIIDEPISFEKAISLLDESDFVLLGGLPYPVSQLPFMKSMQTFSVELQKHVEENFCLYREYKIFEENRRLFINPGKGVWRYKASAETESRYGPTGLVEGKRSQIWHAPWGTGVSSQWVEFQRDNPIKFETLTIVGQDNLPDRAPRNFSLEAYDKHKGWINILNITDADFSKKSSLTWQVKMIQPYSRYRIFVTKNGGSTNLLTIKNIVLGGHNKRECL